MTLRNRWIFERQVYIHRGWHEFHTGRSMSEIVNKRGRETARTGMSVHVRLPSSTAAVVGGLPARTRATAFLRNSTGEGCGWDWASEKQPDPQTITETTLWGTSVAGQFLGWCYLRDRGGHSAAYRASTWRHGRTRRTRRTRRTSRRCAIYRFRTASLRHRLRTRVDRKRHG